MNTLQPQMADLSVSNLTTAELDWSAKKLSHPSITYNKINVINGVNTATINSNATQGAFSFQIPAKVLSLKDSFVSMDLAITNTAGFTILDGNFGSIFSRVVITADTGVVLADINDFHRYCAMLVPASTKQSDLDDNYSGLDTVSTTQATAQELPFGVIQKSNNTQSTSWQADAVTPTVGISPFVNRFRGTTANTHALDRNNTGVRHFVIAESANVATFATYQFRLKDLLPYTLCALEQLLYFGVQLQFDFYLNGIDYIGFQMTSPLMAAGIGAISIAMSGFQFNLAVESNVATINSIVSKVKNEGVRLKIPYVYSSKTAISQSTSHAINQVITATSGKRLLWIAYAPFTILTARDVINSHSADAIVTSYTTTLDNVNIKSQSSINVAKGEHWLYNRRELNGSCIKGANDLLQDFADYTSYVGKSLCQFDPSVEDGLPLTENHTFGVQLNTTDIALNHYVYYCMSRDLILQNFSVQVI